jgi:hypothetical protein
MMDDDMTGDELTQPVDPPDALRALDEVRAPDSLRLAVEHAVADAERARPARRRRTRLQLGAALAAAGAVAAVLLVVLTIGGGDGGTATTGVRAVAPIALRAATAPAPGARRGGELLTAQAGSISFPTWTRAGWRAVGARSDTVGGHRVQTVFYADAAGRRIGYAIADAPLPVAGGRVVTVRGARLRVLDRGATSVVTWRRDGYTCILAGRDVPVGRLLTLASYAA